MIALETAPRRRPYFCRKVASTQLMDALDQEPGTPDPD